MIRDSNLIKSRSECGRMSCLSLNVTTSSLEWDRVGSNDADPRLNSHITHTTKQIHLSEQRHSDMSSYSLKIRREIARGQNNICSNTSNDNLIRVTRCRGEENGLTIHNNDTDDSWRSTLPRWPHNNLLYMIVLHVSIIWGITRGHNPSIIQSPWCVLNLESQFIMQQKCETMTQSVTSINRPPWIRSHCDQYCELQ
jgi:hypothetical protein